MSKSKPKTEWFIFFVFVALVLCYMLAGCATGSKSSAPIEDVIVKYDLFGTVNGKAFEGIGVLDPAASYTFRIESPEDVDLFTITTCHREFVSPNAIKKTGWFSPRRGYETTIKPAPGIEDTGSCLIRLGSYNKTVQGQNAHAILDIRTPTETLPVYNICDGAAGNAGGVSMCQSKVGLIQRLRFDTLVTALTPETAPVTFTQKEKICAGKWIGANTWEYRIVVGECVVGFMEVAKPNRRHRHTVVGYTKVPIRGN